jgi:hypothetical protein
MKRMLTVSVVLGCAVLIGSCSSFAYLQSDDYRQAGIRVTTRTADVANLQLVNRWSTEFNVTYSAEDVAVWAANRLAKDGRHDVLVVVEPISAYDPPARDLNQGENMWRISVYPVKPEDKAK